MNNYICNRCYATCSRGKRPFHITQCGHVYCTACIKKAEAQCLQCKEVGTFSIPIQEQALSKIGHLFVPLNDSLSSLVKVYGFQSSQMTIILKRFNEIDKKYEKLKSRYNEANQQVKMLSEKYYNLKAENDALQKEFISLQMHNNVMAHKISSKNSRLSNPMTLDRSRCSSSSQTITPAQSYDTGTGHTMPHGYYIPGCKLTRSSTGYMTCDTNSSVYKPRR